MSSSDEESYDGGYDSPPEIVSGISKPKHENIKTVQDVGDWRSKEEEMVKEENKEIDSLAVQLQKNGKIV